MNINGSSLSNLRHSPVPVNVGLPEARNFVASLMLVEGFPEWVKPAVRSQSRGPHRPSAVGHGASGICSNCLRHSAARVPNRPLDTTAGVGGEEGDDIGDLAGICRAGESCRS